MRFVARLAMPRPHALTVIACIRVCVHRYERLAGVMSIFLDYCHAVHDVDSAKMMMIMVRSAPASLRALLWFVDFAPS